MVIIVAAKVHCKKLVVNDHYPSGYITLPVFSTLVVKQTFIIPLRLVGTTHF